MKKIEEWKDERILFKRQVKKERMRERKKEKKKKERKKEDQSKSGTAILEKLKAFTSFVFVPRSDLSSRKMMGGLYGCYVLLLL